MERAEAETAARQGYDHMADVYADHVADELAKPSLVRSLLETFAHRVDRTGVVADVGCGPGHVTAFLADIGLDVVGVDISPALLERATTNHPGLRFETGTLASLPFADGAVSAVVAKHSLIHTPAALVHSTLTEFARVVSTGGLLYLSFFAAKTPSTHGRAFDHAVTTAFELDVDAIAASLADAGFVEELRIVRQPTQDERQLPHGTLFARRR